MKTPESRGFGTRRLLTRLAIAAYLAVAGPSIAAASRGANPTRTLTVSPDGVCAGREPCFASLQAAVDAAQSGDTIDLLAGVYPGPILVDGSRLGQRRRGSASGPLLIRRAPHVPAGAVIVRGGGTCTRAVVTVRRIRGLTIRGLTIEASGAGLDLPASGGGSEGVRVEQCRIAGARSCGVGVRVARGRDVVLVGDSIAGFGAEGVRIRSSRGAHAIVGSTVHANGRSGISLGHGGDARIVTTAVADNGLRGSSPHDAGIRRAPSGYRDPGGVLLLGNVVCGNHGGEISPGLLDPSDAANRTPLGSEGPGVTAAGADCAARLFVDGTGADGSPGTADDDVTPALGSALIDGPVDPRGIPEFAVLGASLEADLLGDARRPRDGDGNGTALFDIGAIERQAESTATATASPTATPAPSATPTATPSATSTPTATPTASETPAPDPTATPTATSTATATPTASPTPDATDAPSPSDTPAPSTTPTATSGTPLPPPDRELVDGGSLFGPAGFAIGAVPGTLPTPLGVVVQTTIPPSLELPGGAVAHGDFFFVAGSRDVRSTLGGGFVVALPIPAGVAAEHLGLAVFLAGDAQHPEAWSVLPSLVDPTRRELLTLLPYVPAAGMVLVIVEHPGLVSPVNPGIPGGATSVATGSRTTRATKLARAASSPAPSETPTPSPTATPTSSPAASCPYGSIGFQVVCLLSNPAAQELCTDGGNRFAVRDALVEIFGETVSLGFPLPALYAAPMALQVSPPATAPTCEYNVVIDTDGPSCAAGEDGERNTLGYYLPDMQKLNICIAPINLPLDEVFLRTLHHEYFHAVQYGYPGVQADLADGSEALWMIESSATLFAGSTIVSGHQTIARTPNYPARVVDSPVTALDATREYELQDFWAYLFRDNGTDLVRFNQLFNQGSSLDDVIDWQGGELTFGIKYMEWARNQIMAEKGQDEDGNSIPPCELRRRSATDVKELVDTADANPIEPLTTHVYHWRWDGDVTLEVLRFWETFSHYQGDDKIRFKAYRLGEDCSTTNGGFRRFENVSNGDEFYLVVSNIDPHASRQYTIAFD